MIAVIADDFTGAAEIGGVGLRHGLNVVIETEAIKHSNADLLIIATDTRSLPAKEAVEIITQITRQLLELKPEFIYKKVDSVLRGNIADEIYAQMKVSGKNRAIIIAANPEFNRIIRNGIYYINDIPLSQTSFATDPEFPIQSSLVEEIIQEQNLYTCIQPDNMVPDQGLIIGDVVNTNDLEKWANHFDNNTLLAGASGFFDVLLKKRVTNKPINCSNKWKFGDKALYVIGSTYPKDFDLQKIMEENGHYLSNMPAEIYTNKNFDARYLEDWAMEIVNGIRLHNKVVASVFHTPGSEPDIAFRIRDNIGVLIKKIIEKTELNELIIEGGSTTYSILKHLNIKKLHPIQEIDTGVIRMEIEGIPDLYLTTKPGSYIWPENFWFYQNSESLKSIIH